LRRRITPLSFLRAGRPVRVLFVNFFDRTG
jgi:hypothetical protein